MRIFIDCFVESVRISFRKLNGTNDSTAHGLQQTHCINFICSIKHKLWGLRKVNKNKWVLIWQMMHQNQNFYLTCWYICLEKLALKAQEYYGFSTMYSRSFRGLGGLHKSLRMRNFAAFIRELLGAPYHRICFGPPEPQFLNPPLHCIILPPK